VCWGLTAQTERDALAMRKHVKKRRTTAVKRKPKASALQTRLFFFGEPVTWNMKINIGLAHLLSNENITTSSTVEEAEAVGLRYLRRKNQFQKNY
jgi:hypothetical protein